MSSTLVENNYENKLAQLSKEYEEYKEYSSNIEELLESEIHSRTQEINQLQVQNEKLKEKQSESRKQNEILENKNEEMIKTIESLKLELNKQRIQRVESEVTIDQLEEKMRSLTNQNNQLIEQNNQLTERLIIINEQFQIMQANLEESNKELINEISEIKEDQRIAYNKKIQKCFHSIGIQTQSNFEQNVKTIEKKKYQFSYITPTPSVCKRKYRKLSEEDIAINNFEDFLQIQESTRSSLMSQEQYNISREVNQLKERKQSLQAKSISF